jgi:hypothetical protein
MSSIEVAFDLKDVTNYLIACPTEIMVYGFPYKAVGKYLIGNVDYSSVCKAFYDFYNSYSTQCGTIGVTDCSQLDSLTRTMKKINSKYSINSSSLAEVQRMDGYSPVIFYDYGSYVNHLCKDSILLNEFNLQLERSVPYKSHTSSYYSAMIGAVYINSYSGITTSDPSNNALSSSKVNTRWYRATHQ